MDVAESLIQKMMDDYDEEIHPKYYMMDAGYDKPELFGCYVRMHVENATVRWAPRGVLQPPAAMSER